MNYFVLGNNKIQDAILAYAIHIKRTTGSMPDTVTIENFFIGICPKECIVIGCYDNEALVSMAILRIIHKTPFDEPEKVFVLTDIICSEKYENTKAMLVEHCRLYAEENNGIFIS